MPQTDARPVLLDPGTDPGWTEVLATLTRQARDLAAGEVTDVLAWAASCSDRVPRPAGGRTRQRWELLASVGAQDLTVARVLEPHLDAVAILAEAGQAPPPGSTWGVWAAEGPGARLEAEPLDAGTDEGTDEPTDDGTRLLHGRKPWCSLAGEVTHALVTAWVDDTTRGLYAVELADPGLLVEEGTWVPRGLQRVVTTPVSMSDVPGRPVGADGWYLERDGFWWGGIGVAAVWYGGAVGLARRLASGLAGRPPGREPDQLALMHLGEVDAALAAARTALTTAADEVDAGRTTGTAAILLGARVRHVVATTVEVVGRHVAHALGPGPLSQEPEHAARVADLALYVRQHHGERDAAGLGRLVLEQAPW